MEQWAEMPGFVGYEVSNRGRVRSWRYHSNGRLLRPSRVPSTTTVGWYLQVSFYRDGEEDWRERVTKMVVHRAVLLAFAGLPPTEKHEARHLDGNGLNNRLENLAWGTREENVADRKRHNTNCPGERNAGAKLTEDDVRWIRTCERPAEEMAKRLGVHVQTIHRIQRGDRWSHLPGIRAKVEMKDRVRGPDGTFIGVKA